MVDDRRAEPFGAEVRGSGFIVLFGANRGFRLPDLFARKDLGLVQSIREVFLRRSSVRAMHRLSVDAAGRGGGGRVR